MSTASTIPYRTLLLPVPTGSRYILSTSITLLYRLHSDSTKRFSHRLENTAKPDESDLVAKMVHVTGNIEMAWRKTKTKKREKRGQTGDDNDANAGTGQRRDRHILVVQDRQVICAMPQCSSTLHHYTYKTQPPRCQTSPNAATHDTTCRCTGS